MDWSWWGWHELRLWHHTRWELKTLAQYCIKVNKPGKQSKDCKKAGASVVDMGLDLFGESLVLDPLVFAVVVVGDQHNKEGIDMDYVVNSRAKIKVW